ncbi:MAG: DUF4252 domain-containing protein [Bacteroidales bacterium]|nr:DUF4252 domain-containing protein [Candidatus Cacconaster scatequi]
MKRFVLLVCAVMLSWAAEAGDAAALFRSYSEKEGVTAVTLTGRTFNLMKPFLGLDRETKRLFNALNLQRMDMLEIDCKSSSIDRGKVLEDLSGLCADSLYVSIRTLSDADIEENSDFLFRIEGERIVDVVIYALKGDGLVAMMVSCDAELSRIKAALGEKRND